MTQCRYCPARYVTAWELAEHERECPERNDTPFERVDFCRLAMAFGIPIERVHEAVGKTGTLYRQRANRDLTRDEMALLVHDLLALANAMMQAIDSCGDQPIMAWRGAIAATLSKAGRTQPLTQPTQPIETK